MLYKTGNPVCRRSPGYRGARFSGVPFICESLFDDGRIIKFIGNLKFRKTSRGKPIGELTAKAIWEAMELIGKPAIFWNIYPFHLHNPRLSMSNRNPTKKEILKGTICHGW